MAEARQAETRGAADNATTTTRQAAGQPRQRNSNAGGRGRLRRGRRGQLADASTVGTHNAADEMMVAGIGGGLVSNEGSSERLRHRSESAEGDLALELKVDPRRRGRRRKAVMTPAFEDEEPSGRDRDAPDLPTTTATRRQRPYGAHTRRHATSGSSSAQALDTRPMRTRPKPAKPSKGKKRRAARQERSDKIIVALPTESEDNASESEARETPDELANEPDARQIASVTHSDDERQDSSGAEDQSFSEGEGGTESDYTDADEEEPDTENVEVDEQAGVEHSTTRRQTLGEDGEIIIGVVSESEGDGESEGDDENEGDDESDFSDSKAGAGELEVLYVQVGTVG